MYYEKQKQFCDDYLNIQEEPITFSYDKMWMSLQCLSMV